MASPRNLGRPALLATLLVGFSVPNSFAGSSLPTGVFASLHSRVGTASCELVQRATLVITKRYASIQIEGKTSETYSLEMGPDDYLEVLASVSENVTKEARNSGFKLKSESQIPMDLPKLRGIQGDASCPSLQDAVTEVDEAREQRRKDVQGKLYKAGAGDVTLPIALKQEIPEPDSQPSQKAGNSNADANRKSNFRGNGTVSLIALIDIDGSVKQTKLVRSSSPELEKKAADAVARWKFEPARKKGLPVPSYLPVEINFHLR
jgi:TonB family protein